MNYTCYSTELEEVTHLRAGSSGGGGRIFNQGAEPYCRDMGVPFLTLSLLFYSMILGSWKVLSSSLPSSLVWLHLRSVWPKGDDSIQSSLFHPSHTVPGPSRGHSDQDSGLCQTTLELPLLFSFCLILEFYFILFLLLNVLG